MNPAFAHITLDFFVKGGPMMWPLLWISTVALTVLIERALLVVRERCKRHGEAVESILGSIEQGNVTPRSFGWLTAWKICGADAGVWVAASVQFPE